MAGFLYFRSGDSRPIDMAGVQQLGLDYILDAGARLQSRQANGNTPSGEKGLLFGDARRHSGAIKVDLNKQTWRELPESIGGGNVWVGFWTAEKPCPEELQRVSMLNGPTIRMADGHAWQVPIVRRFDDQTEQWESQLPAYLDYDKQGKVVRGKPIAEHARLWELTAPLASQEFEAMSQSDEGNEQKTAGPSEDDVYTAVVALLQANYVVGLPELVMLQTLADDQSLALVAMASCRYEQLMEWIASAQKKSNQPAASGLNLYDGEAD